MKKIFTLITLFAMTIGAMAQSQYFYEWKNGKYVQRSLAEVDSITFSLPEVPENEYQYVDLGLPSGTLWADRNVGADSPEAYGDYFAWGETRSKDYYYLSTYKWCKGDYGTMTKYCTNGSAGTVDNKTVLDLEDDAAYVNMGAEWRMPTYDELNELKSNCTWNWTTQNGVNGHRVTGPNGNSIFLPATGYRSESNLYNVGSYGYYWSSSLCGDWPSLAWSLSFVMGDYILYNSGRDGGHTVRAVKNTAKVQGSIVGVWEKKSGANLIKFNADGTGSIEEESEVLGFGYTFNSSTSVVTITSGVFVEDDIKQIKIKFIADNIIQLGWWIDGEWYFEEDEKYYRQDVVEAKVNKVDLGLPSGTLWADRNVGADSPEAYGAYFAWGETSTKSTYDWSTYKWSEGSTKFPTKYCTNSAYGIVDNKTVLDLEDDAAYVNMGTDWRMPTYEELCELYYECTWTWTILNGTNGYTVTGHNGKSIFLPAAGSCMNSNFHDKDVWGCYWSSSLYDGDPYSAWRSCYSSNTQYHQSDSRCYGHTVRAVAR